MAKIDVFQNLYIIFYKGQVLEIKTFGTSAESWLYLEEKGLDENYYDVIGPFKNNEQIEHYLQNKIGKNKRD